MLLGQQNEPQMNVARVINPDELTAIQREMRTALLAHRNRHGDEPFAVFHIFGGVNTDWLHENLAIAALTRAYERKYGIGERAKRAASRALGRIFKWVLYDDRVVTYAIDHQERFRDGLSRTFYRVIGRTGR